MSNIFMSSNPNIINNAELREPQVEAYIEVHRHFEITKKKSNALVVLPTGVGKTGLMGILPYFISHGRVLIVTPQVSIKDTVIDSLNPDKYDNFWLKRKVFSDEKQLPVVIEYSSDLPREILDMSNIVILNIHKLQKRLASSPLNFLPRNFFDMIIIDEAHHSTAKSWVETVLYFKDAKVVKLTGTPFRTDGQELAGELAYKYPLGKAMANNFVKSLENIYYVPDELYLTIDGDGNKYTLEELYEKNIRDEDWVARNVAFSVECSSRIVDESLRLLNKKITDNPRVKHKIIGVACSIPHAEQIKQLYEERGYATTIIHSKLSDLDKQRAFNDIKNHRVKVVINVAMLGEGYDHEYLSIAAIFRPFKAELPYVQFIGRILRFISDEEATHPGDNIGQIISHKNLGLEKLWEKYKKEINESEIIKYLKEQDELEEEDYTTSNPRITNSELDFGKVTEIGEGSLNSQAYLDTELLRRYNEETEAFNEKVKQIQTILGVTQDEAAQVVRNTEGQENPLRRPDIFFKKVRKDIDVRIREDMVPELINNHNINKSGVELNELKIFHGKYKWIANNIKNNAGMLATYFNTYLKDEMGNARDTWTIEDYEIANTKLDGLFEYVDNLLDDFIK